MDQVVKAAPFGQMRYLKALHSLEAEYLTALKRGDQKKATLLESHGAAFLASCDLTGDESDSAMTHIHNELHHYWWSCSCGQRILRCDEDASHTQLNSFHRWKPVPHPLGNYEVKLTCDRGRHDRIHMDKGNTQEQSGASLRRALTKQSIKSAVRINALRPPS